MTATKLHPRTLTPRPLSLAVQRTRESHVEHVLTTLAVLVLLGAVGLLVPQANRWAADQLRPLHMVAVAEQELQRARP